MTATPLDLIEARAQADPGCREADCFAGNCVMRHDRVQLVAALRAVEAVHHPMQYSAKRFICGHCQYEPRTVIEWPCPTITAIREALG